MPGEKTYKLGDDVFDIPEAESGAFLADNPNAIEVKSYLKGKDTFDIPIVEVDDFLQGNPDAKPLKKKSASQPLSLGYGSAPEAILPEQKIKPQGSVPPISKSVLPSKSVSPKLTEFNKKYGTNYTPEQIQGKEPIVEEVGVAEGAGRNFLGNVNSLFAATMGVPQYITNMAINPILEIAGMPEEAKKVFFESYKSSPANPNAGLNAIQDYYKKDANKILAPVQKQYSKSVTDEISKGNYLEAAKQAGVQIAGSLPATLGIVAATSAGVPLAAITPIGGTVFGSQNYQDVDPNNTMTEAQKQLNTFGKGLAEGVFEQIGTGYLAKTALKTIEKEGAKEAAKIFKNQYVEAAKSALSPYFPVTAPILEGLTEAGTQAAQNLIDKYTNPDKNDISLTEGVGDAFVLGGVMGTAFGAAPTIVQGIRDIKNRDKAKEYETQIAQIDNDLDNPDVSDAAKQVLTQQRTEVLQEANDLIEQDRQEFDKLSPQQQEKTVGITAQVDQVEQALSDPNLSEESKSALTARSESLISQLEKLKQEEPQAGEPVTEETIQESEESKITDSDMLLSDSKVKQEVEKLTDEERAALTPIEEVTGKNFREIANVYAKHGEGKPLSEITVEDYQKAEEKRQAEKLVTQEEGEITNGEINETKEASQEAEGLLTTPQEQEGGEVEVSAPVSEIAKNLSITEEEKSETELLKEDLATAKTKVKKEAIQDRIDELEAEEGGETSVKHSETEKLREEFGIPSYERTPKKQKQLESEAQEKLDKGYNIAKLVKKLEEGTLPTDVEQVIMTKYLAGLADKIAKNPSDELIAEARKAIEASDKIGGTEVARSLAARRGVEKRDEALMDYFMREMDINQDAPLTEQQKQKVQKEFEEITKAKEELEKKIAELQEEVTRMQAERNIPKKPQTKAKKSHDDYVKERKEIADSMKEKLRKMRAETNVAIIPYVKELAVISPDVAKMVKTYVEEGVDKLDDLVKLIHEELKVVIPDITKKDVRGVIAGDYNEKKPTKSELSSQIYELKQEAKLINKIEDLQAGKEPKTEQKRIERNIELESLRKQIREHDLTKIKTYKSRVLSQIEKLEKQLKDGDVQQKEIRKPLQLDAEAIRLKDKFIKLKQERELRLLRQEYANRNKYEKARDKILDVANVPRTVMSSMDFSAPLRQAVVATTAHPTMAMNAMAEMFKQAVSQKRFDRWFYDIRNDPRFAIAEQNGLYIADPHDPRLSAKEEAFMNNLAEKIPVIGKMIKGSERAYVSYLNKMRWDLYNQYAETFESEGITPYNDPATYKALAGFINNATGRGKLGSLESAAPILNSVFFSPRLVASRLAFLNPVYYYKLPPKVRILAMKNIAKFIGAGLTTLALIQLGDTEDKVTVEPDPRSTDFGKIKIGNTRWDIWGGYQQYIRVLSQLFSGQTKSAMTGEMSDLSGEGAFGRTRADVIKTFVRGKLAPIPSVVVDALTKRTITGEKTAVAKELESHLFPLIYADVKETMKDQGVKGLFTAGVPATFGVGVSSYTPRDDKYSLPTEGADYKLSDTARKLTGELTDISKKEREASKAQQAIDRAEIDKEFNITPQEKQIRELKDQFPRAGAAIVITELEKVPKKERREKLDRWLSMELVSEDLYNKLNVTDNGDIEIIKETE